AVLLYTLSRTSDSPPVCFLVNDTLSVCESFVFLFVITPTFIIEPKKVEVQEALPPAGVIGAEPLTLVLQHFPRKPA
ncbi:MAG: hypothetical protein SO010_01835, partial [Candidatus Limiplasma sp.]|nr:hypothetical protein [Candidatus Limiplasma sp.]